MSIPEELLNQPFTRIREAANVDGRSPGPDYLPFYGYRAEKVQMIENERGKQLKSTSVLVPRDPHVDIVLDDRIAEGHPETGDGLGRSFEVIADAGPRVPIEAEVHHRQVYLK